MNSSRSSLRLIQSSQRSILTLRRSPATWLVLTLLIAISCLASVGCLRPKEEVIVARATKMPEEIKGFMRLVQTKVKVQVIGQDSVGEFDASEKTTMERKPEYKNLSAYIVLHEQDVAQFVRNTDLLNKLAEDPEIRALAVKKGILK